MCSERGNSCLQRRRNIPYEYPHLIKNDDSTMHSSHRTQRISSTVVVGCVILGVMSKLLTVSYSGYGRDAIDGSKAIGGMFPTNHRNNEMVIPIFYNIYVESPSNVQEVTAIVQEQLTRVLPEHRVFVRFIGTPLAIEGATILQQDVSGNEIETLGLLWDYCNAHPQQKVVYIHSKGSFHPSEKNTASRQFLTRGVLSKECMNLPDSCNVCSSRMSPIPHPHTPGNMWLARCRYVKELIDPRKFEEKMNMIPIHSKHLQPCIGQGRFAAEHWVHSHPTVSACDLSEDENYVWGYDHIPPADFEMNLKMAPRFPYDYYVREGCGHKKQNRTKAIEEGMSRLNEYKLLYGNFVLPEKTWYGWEFYGLDDFKEFNSR